MRNKKIFICDCSSIEHQIIIHSDDEEIYFQFYVENYLPFYQRLINFFCFLFKKSSYYHDSSYIIINHEEEKELKNHLETINYEIEKNKQ
jgi:hypothetical protein